jgi:hypothetical protein
MTDGLRNTQMVEAKIMRALAAAGSIGLSRSQISRTVLSWTPTWKVRRALRRLHMTGKVRRETVKLGPHRPQEMWFALILDDTLEHGLAPEWTFEVEGT